MHGSQCRFAPAASLPPGRAWQSRSLPARVRREARRARGPWPGGLRWRPRAAMRRRPWRAGSRALSAHRAALSERAGRLFASRAAGRVSLVVGIVAAAGVLIREPQLLVLLVF